MEFTPGPELLSWKALHTFSCDQEYDMTAAVGGAPVVDFRQGLSLFSISWTAATLSSLSYEVG